MAKTYYSVQRYRYPKESRKYNTFVRSSYNDSLELRDLYWQLAGSLQDSQNALILLLNKAASIATVVRLHKLKQSGS